MNKDIALAILVNLARRCRMNKKYWRTAVRNGGQYHHWTMYYEGEYRESWNALQASKAIYREMMEKEEE
jgi:hypothetical protein